ncbi:type II secretion system F family protein [Duganella sp. CY15W]|uniref:type II secretion system F family protein n=1 Tax=Duganella sp. CY15W TaxID=2692172 RepID=UPI00136C2A82|nr:type II secretion system F family protein [Duganella sp. CY15W]MYM28503.1 type II secretion system F family protein [Duganella sp. CY15W]
MQFIVRTFDAASAAYAERTVDGDNPQDVQRALERQGLTVLSVTAPARRISFARAAQFDVVLFCDELRTLLSSGMSLVEAVDTLSGKQSSGDKHAVLLEIRQHLLEGKPFSSALELNRYDFPVLLIASVRASERSSRIDHALEEFVAYEKVGRELSKKIVSAAIYPVMVVGFGMLVSLFMLSYVVPRFSRVYEDFAHGISTPTLILIRIGAFFDAHLPLVLAALLAVMVALVLAYRSGTLKTVALRLLGRFQLVRHHLRLYQLSRIFQTLAMLLKGGFTLSDAMPLARELAFDARLRRQLDGARLQVNEGRRMSQSFAEQGLTDNVTVRLLQVGERSGNLDKTMEIIAQTYRQELMLFIERTTRIAEPLLLMVVGVMIGAIIILMYMPVFDLAGGV